MVTRGKENQIGNLLQENNLSLFARKLLNWLHLAGLLTFPGSNAFPSYVSDSGQMFKPATNDWQHWVYSYGDSFGFAPNSL